MNHSTQRALMKTSSTAPDSTKHKSRALATSRSCYRCSQPFHKNRKTCWWLLSRKSPFSTLMHWEELFLFPIWIPKRRHSKKFFFSKTQKAGKSPGLGKSFFASKLHHNQAEKSAFHVMFCCESNLKESQKVIMKRGHATDQDRSMQTRRERN